MICKPRRFFQPSRQNAAASVDTGNSGLELRCNAAVAAVVVIVRIVVEAAMPEGVTVGGEKLHVAPVGSPEQANVTAEANEFCGVTDTVAVPLCPPVTVSAVGTTATVKFGEMV